MAQSTVVETTRQKFERIAVMRVGNAITAIRRIRTLANKRTYDFTEAHAKEIGDALKAEVNEVARLFDAALKGKEVAKPSDSFIFTKR